MHIKFFTLIFIGLLTFSSSSMAIECQVEYKAKRITEKAKWYGKVETPEFKSGIASGEGEHKKSCEEDALQSIRSDGWEITYHKLKEATENQSTEAGILNNQLVTETCIGDNCPAADSTKPKKD